MPQQEAVSDEVLLEAGKRADSPVFTARDVADEVGLGIDGVRWRLKKLRKSGVLESKRVGARAIVWWVSD